MRMKDLIAISESDNILKLTAKGGRLYVNGEMLLTISRGGDPEVPPWPFKKDSYWTKEKWNEVLAGSLFDARETGDIPSSTKEVLLPDGKTFVIDDHVK